MAAARAIALSALALGLAAVSARTVKDRTPSPCKNKYEADELSSWVDAHLAKVPDTSRAGPQLLLLMGGSGSGKGTFLRRWAEAEAAAKPESPSPISSFVMHGLDEYLEYIPEYAETLRSADSVYKDAADACYPGAAIPAAKEAMGKIVAGRKNLIYEETGKNLDRIRKRVLPPYVDSGYRTTVVFIDNDPETAIARSAGRFQSTGRYAPDEYIRDTFSNAFSSYGAVKEITGVSEAVYCDNSGETMRCWANSPRDQDALVPEGVLLDGAPEFKATKAPGNQAAPDREL